MGESSSPMDRIDLNEPKTDEAGRFADVREVIEGRERLGEGWERDGLRVSSSSTAATSVASSRLVTREGAFRLVRVLGACCFAGSWRGVGWIWVNEGIEPKMLFRLFGLDMTGQCCGYLLVRSATWKPEESETVTREVKAIVMLSRPSRTGSNICYPVGTWQDSTAQHSTGNNSTRIELEETTQI